MYAVSATLTMTGTTFSSNSVSSATSHGGGAYLSSCMTTMLDCVFSDNYASDYGGGLYTIGGSTTVNHTDFDSNYAPTGGGWYVVSGSAALTSSYFVGNSGTLGYRDMHRAGGTVLFETGCPAELYFYGKDLLDCYTCSVVFYPKDMRDMGCMSWTSYETANTQDELESAIMFDRRIELTADISLTHAVAVLGFENQASGKLLGTPIAREANLTGLVIDGAGIYTLDGGSTYRCFYINNPSTEVTITNLTIANGYASIYADVYTSSQGGAIYTGSSITLSLLCCVVSASTASTGSCKSDASYGGGVYMGINGNLLSRGSNFTSNRAYQGSGLYLSSGTEALIEDCTFDSNTYYNYRSSCSSNYGYQSYGKLGAFILLFYLRHVWLT